MTDYRKVIPIDFDGAVAEDEAILILVNEDHSDYDILKSIDQLAALGDFEVDIRKAIDEASFESWFLEYVFDNNIAYFDRWKKRLYADMRSYLKREKIFPLNEREYDALQRFLTVYRDALIHNVTGWELSKERIEALRSKGLLDTGVYRLPEISYKLGMLHDWIRKEAAGWDNRDAFFKFLSKRAKDIRLSSIDRTAIQAAKSQVHGYLRPTVDNLLHGGIKALHEEENEIASVIASGMREREHPFIQGRRLRRALDQKGFQRDYDRVARTQIAESYNKGAWGYVVNSIKRFGLTPEETLVFRVPSPRCCEHCSRLYLQKDQATPKLYKFTTAAAAGSNYALKPVEWKPVIGATHPNCRCSPFQRAIKGVTDQVYPDIFNYKSV